MVTRTEITIGCDPEYFLKREGRFTAAEFTGCLGTKEKPVPLPRGGAVQVDGCALEFNIAPAKTAREFDLNIQNTLDDIRFVIDPSFEFHFLPSVTFEKTDWDRISKESKMLGCEPDYDAYTRMAKTPPQGAADRPFRTASGHIHVGFLKDADVKDPSHIYDCAVVTQFLDRVLGQYQRLWDNDQTRRSVYGDYGSFRPKPYGLEYRVLSNKWVLNRPLRRFLFEYVSGGVKYLLDGRAEFFKYPAERSSLNASAPYVMAGLSKRFGCGEAMREAVNSGSFTFLDSMARGDVLRELGA